MPNKLNEVIWDHLESFKSWGNKSSFSTKMQRCSKMHCPFLVSGYYRYPTLCCMGFIRPTNLNIPLKVSKFQKHCMVSSILSKNQCWDNFHSIKSSQRLFFGRIEDIINYFKIYWPLSQLTSVSKKLGQSAVVY